jgi:hypothetical protein
MRHRIAIAGEDLVGAEGMALAAGRLVATVVSQKTGQHITIRLTCKRPPRGEEKRWRVCPFEQAQRVFADIPRGTSLLTGESPGVYIPAEGVFRETRGADKARVWATLFALKTAAGIERTSDATVLHQVNCLHCGRALTDPESIARGLGPDCYGKLTSSRHQRRGATPTETIGTPALEQTRLGVC